MNSDDKPEEKVEYKPTKEEVEQYNKEVSNLTKSAPKYVMNPVEYIRKFYDILDDGVRRRIISYEYAEQKKAELYHKANTPSRMKERLRQQLINMRNKVMKKKDIKEIKESKINVNDILNKANQNRNEKK